MADHSKIEWTDYTWNVITGCSVLSAGCTNCYAMKLAGTRLQHEPSRAGLTRDSAAGPVWTGEVRFNAKWLDDPLQLGRPRKVFVCAHGDLFHEDVPDFWIDRVFAVMALAPWHTFQVLTKRADRMWAYLTDPGVRARIARRIARYEGNPAAPVASKRVADGGDYWPLPNVWLGVSVENQAAADDRIPALLEAPAVVRWVSAEPLLGPVDLVPYLYRPVQPEEVTGDAVVPGGWMTMEGVPRLDWLVVGGESGAGARPMHPSWARTLRDQCARAGVAFLFKQWGSHSLHEIDAASRVVPPMPMRLLDVHLMRPGETRFTKTRGDLPIGELFAPGNTVATRHLRKHEIGRALDGVVHDAYPVRAPVPPHCPKERRHG